MLDEITSKEIITHVEKEIKKTNFGEIKIELSENKGSVDVVTTCRKRFIKKGAGMILEESGERVPHEG